LLDNIDQIVVLPTGSGKSICYMLPSLLKPGVTVVVSPLLALLRDQVLRLNTAGIKSGILKGGITSRELKELKRNIGTGETGIIFTTPEALENEASISFFSGINIASIVIDEAHCVYEWGESFRPSYLNLGRFMDRFKDASVTAFTATASERVIDKIKRYLYAGRNPLNVVENPDRPNIHYSVIPCISKSRAVERLIAGEKRPMLIFVRSRKRAEGLSGRILSSLETINRSSESGDVRFYHAGLTGPEREGIENWFLNSRNGILCATSAYGLGVDKGNIRTVIHYDVPRSVESYLQESGRGGRDGEKASSVMLYSADDVMFLNEIISETERERYSAIIKYVLTDDICRREQLLECVGWREGFSCSSCDVCEGTASGIPEGFYEIERFISKHRKQFSVRGAVQILKGKSSYDTVRGYLYRFKEYGLLGEWSENNLEEALNSMLQSRCLRVVSRGMFKHKLTSEKKWIPWKDNLRMLLKNGL